MKRYICVILAAAMLLSLCACGFPEDQAEDAVLFYYPRKEIAQGGSDSVISSEVRGAQDYTTDLSNLLRLYLRGPASSDLRSPFPAGLQLVQVAQEGDTLNIVLGSASDGWIGLEKTLAYACLTLTCLELTDATAVSITTEAEMQAGEKPTVMDRSCLLLLDESAAAATEEADQS